jgi:hypothetical protein
MKSKINFIIRGDSISLNQKDVINAVKGLRPEPIRKYYIEIDSNRYPIKQALFAAAKIPLASFTSQDAFRVLKKLEFDIKEIGT